MLTCKVGETIINCFDGKYDKYTLKQWSDKSKLICPDCSKPYEYCHGEVVSPYFRHKEKSKECEDVFSEPETQEHIKGKMILYKWLQELEKQGEIQNVKLESYIPETHQRPDIYFEHNNERFVVEFQCSPIATEFLERHRLYELAKVHDIWILGTDKYKIIIDKDQISHNTRFKTIEEYTNLYLNVLTEDLIVDKNIITKYLPYNGYWISQYQKNNMNNFKIDFSEKSVKLNDKELEIYIEKDKEEHKEYIEKEIQKNKDISMIKELIEEINLKYKNFKDGLYFFEDGYGYLGKYIMRIHFDKKSNDSHFGSCNIYSFFIKDNKTDCCEEYQYSQPFTGRKGGVRWRKCTGYRKLYSIEYSKLDKDILKNFILEKVQNYLRCQIYGANWMDKK